MAKLYFRYGAMGSSKTANALMVKYNYEEKNQKILLLKPAIENRDGANIIKSRIGLSSRCILIEDFIYNFSEYDLSNIKAIIIDEAQFMKVDQVDFFSDIVDYYDIPVICYGLKTDFKGVLFEGSKRLIELADIIEEIPTVCWCGRKARFNARIHNGKIVKEGDQIEMGANDKYVSLCRKHYKDGILKKEDE